MEMDAIVPCLIWPCAHTIKLNIFATNLAEFEISKASPGQGTMTITPIRTTYLVHNVKPDAINALISACIFPDFSSSVSMRESNVSLGYLDCDQSIKVLISSIVIASAWFLVPPSAPHLFLIVFIRSSVAAALAGLPSILFVFSS